MNLLINFQDVVFVFNISNSSEQLKDTFKSELFIRRSVVINNIYAGLL